MLLLRTGGAGLGLAAFMIAAAPATADHPGPLRETEMSPLAVGLLSGGLALAAALLLLVIVMLLRRKEPSSE